MVLAPVGVDEVDDVAESQPVNQIAERATDDQRKGRRLPPVAALGALERHDQSEADPHRQRREQPALPAIGILQEAESSTVVVEQGPVQPTLDDRHRLRVPQMVQREVLGPQVQGKDDRRQQQPDQRMASWRTHQNQRRSSPAPSTLSTQRPQSSGCSA